ncbi:hypothetical protein QBC37DRAFT_76298 [Rhypophila decipiens]|uniref:Chromo domain-containing protein n=1 Tax=Rhypophila decipiens TaxID=261697 RepID=A0AAN6YJR6_9PEZI|nr:hypothetical protein QBC37DRAFT_76298 [Rhypophila decipiens]
MPPAISDNEEGSDIELENSPRTTKLASREKRKPSTSKEPEPIVDEEAQDESNEEEEEDEEGERDEEEGDEEFVVEKILSHVINEEGKPLFEVKWEGYEKLSDRTWEPEDNLKENASGILTAYLKSIGGRNALFEQTNLALKTKKRGRPSQGTPSTSGKRRRNGDHESESGTPPASARVVEWVPPAGSWEDHIAKIDAAEDETTKKLMVYLTWKNGHKTQHDTKVVYQRCPQKMLQFYEHHVRIIKVAEEETPATPDMKDDLKDD